MLRSAPDDMLNKVMEVNIYTVFFYRGRQKYVESPQLVLLQPLISYTKLVPFNYRWFETSGGWMK